MRSSIPLGWLLATVIFALLGNAWLTVAFSVMAAAFSFMAYATNYKMIEGHVVSEVLQEMSQIAKGENDES